MDGLDPSFVSMILTGAESLTLSKQKGASSEGSLFHSDWQNEKFQHNDRTVQFERVHSTSKIESTRLFSFSPLSSLDTHINISTNIPSNGFSGSSISHTFMDSISISQETSHFQHGIFHHQNRELGLAMPLTANIHTQTLPYWDNTIISNLPTYTNNYYDHQSYFIPCHLNRRQSENNTKSTRQPPSSFLQDMSLDDLEIQATNTQSPETTQQSPTESEFSSDNHNELITRPSCSYNLRGTRRRSSCGSKISDSYNNCSPSPKGHRRHRRIRSQLTRTFSCPMPGCQKR